MRLFSLKTTLSTIQKIAISGVFIALITVLQKVIALNYIPGLPFFRLSFGGPALIIFASILLGPWFGLLVGAGSDILGYFVFDMSGMGWFPQVTAIYAMLGFTSYFVFQLVRLIKNKKVVIFVELASLVVFFVVILLYFLMDSTALLWQKIVFPASVLVLLLLIFALNFIFDKKMELALKYNVFQVSLCLFVLETIVMLVFGTVMKGCAFGFDIYPIIFICQLMVLFFNLTVNTVMIPTLFRVTKKYFILEDQVKK